MKNRSPLFFIILVLFAGIHPALAQLPLITSFSQNGFLVCTNLNPGSVAAVAWASCLNGPWQTNLPGLNAVTVQPDETIQVSVPMTNPAAMYFRVLGIPAGAIATITSDGMTLIPAGSFTMGDTLDGEIDAVPTNVFVSAFYMETNLVTYTEWQSVYNYATNNGYDFDYSGAGKATNHPVQMVNWYDVAKWCNARSQQAGLTPFYYTDAALTQVYTNGDAQVVYPNWSTNGYRLPTEAEWEKAARGGFNGQRFPWGNTISESQANYYADTNDYVYDLGPYDGANTNFASPIFPYTSPVGYFGANGYGLNDMAGNVWEWCWDWYGTSYAQPTTNNPTGPASGAVRVLRGGAWINTANNARCAYRGSYSPNAPGDFIGFRCVRQP
jgi:formylglycine-generating enzyme